MVGVLLRGMAFLPTGYPGSRLTLPVMQGGVHASLPEAHGELEIPDDVNLSDLIEAANHFDVLNAPIDGRPFEFQLRRAGRTMRDACRERRRRMTVAAQISAELTSFFAMLSAQRGHGIEEIAARLMELSTKAEENGEQNARLTAENAGAAVNRQRQRSRA